MNMTIDGFCDHTAGIPDQEIHQHYTDLLNNAGCVLYGRVTYQLMEYWKPIAKSPTGDKSSDEFALAIDKVPKIVFSHTLKQVDWESARLATQSPEEEVLKLRQQAGNDIFICSPSLIVALTKLNLVDEYQLCIHPVVVGSGLLLFKNISDRIIFKLKETKTFAGGSIILCYES